MIFYYSNQGHLWANPEALYPNTGNMMLTYFLYAKKGVPCKRLARVIKARRTGRLVKVSVKKKKGS